MYPSNPLGLPLYDPIAMAAQLQQNGQQQFQFQHRGRGRGGRGRGNFQLSNQVRREREPSTPEANTQYKRNRGNFNNNNNNNRGRHSNSNNPPTSSGENVNVVYDLYIGYWSDVIKNSSTKDSFRKSASYCSKNLKFYMNDEFQLNINSDTFGEFKFRHIFLRFNTRNLEDQELLEHANGNTTPEGKIGARFSRVYAEVNSQVLKILTHIKPSGNIFFVIGSGPYDAIISGYAVMHSYPIVQVQCRLRKPNVDDLTDEDKKAQIVACRIVDTAKKYFNVGNSASPRQNILQD